LSISSLAPGEEACGREQKVGHHDWETKFRF
jgi:hypothetical protein